MVSKMKDKKILTLKEYIKKDDGRIRILFLIILLLSSWTLNHAVRIYAANTDSRIQEGITDEIIRFHVIANSDSEEDQRLKLRVKDTLVHALSPYLREANDINEARAIIQNNLPYIHDVAAKTIKENGYEYPVTASLSYCYFPMKVYGEYIFSPGSYEALRVQIGAAQGKNWWCVMFPPLCFVDETYSIIDEDSELKLKYLLTEDELDLLKNNKVPIRIRFKLFDAIKKLFG